MQPKIVRTDLPETILIVLVDGSKLHVSHLGNRIEVSVINGQPLVIHPKSGNVCELMIGDSSELSKPFDPNKLI